MTSINKTLEPNSGALRYLAQVPVYYFVLIGDYETKRMNQLQFSRVTAITPAYLHRTLKLFTDEGLVNKESETKYVYITLTPKGKMLYKELKGFLTEFNYKF